jgi:hypothetical protein
MKWKILCMSLVLLLISIPGIAQTVYNPKIVQFDSLDHANACPATNCINSYKIELWLQGVDPATGAPISTFDLAKNRVIQSGLPAAEPQLQANLADTVPLFSYPAGQSYVLRMIAVGIDPLVVSARSNATGPFAAADAPRSLVNVRVK